MPSETPSRRTSVRRPAHTGSLLRAGSSVPASLNDNTRMGHTEAVKLAAALVTWTARSIDCRVLLVKGLALEHHQLRAHRSGGDVDLLVDPSRASDLREALASAGWEDRPLTEGADKLAWYARTLVNGTWPVDIDLHSSFPGFAADERDVFETLWATHQGMLLAGHAISIPDLLSSIAIWALHSLSGSDRQPRHQQELARLCGDVLPRMPLSIQAQLGERVIDLAADEALRAIPEFATILGDRHGRRAPAAHQAWLAKVAQSHEVTPWLQVLRESSSWELPRLLFRAAWPSAHDLRLLDEALVDTPWGRVRSRGRRAWRLVRRIVERRRQAR